jgi:hypothetical protein
MSVIVVKAKRLTGTGGGRVSYFKTTISTVIRSLLSQVGVVDSPILVVRVEAVPAGSARATGLRLGW